MAVLQKAFDSQAITIATASGERSINAGQDISGIVASGNQNTIQNITINLPQGTDFAISPRQAPPPPDAVWPAGIGAGDRAGHSLLGRE